MSDHVTDPLEGHEPPFSPTYSQLESVGLSSNQAPTRSQSPAIFNPMSDLAASSNSEVKSSNYFAALEATVEGLQNRAQNLIDKINEGRNQDQTLIKKWNDNISMKVTELCQRLEDRMYQVYDHHNKLLQDRLQELPEIIDRIGQLQAELKQVCQTVVTVYKDLCVQPEI
ncbi:synaptonemal complex central element protein 2 [Discoglossus pictus]